MQRRTLGVVMDPIAAINPKKDTTLAMLLEAQRRGYALAYMELPDLELRDGRAWATSRELVVHEDLERWYELGAGHERALDELAVILMRKDPPFDMEYIYATYVLEQAERGGALVINRPQALRDANEKLFTAWFPECTPPTLVARRPERLRAFLADQGDVVVKPLDGMGGRSIFRVTRGDPNTSVILETITAQGTRFAMAQRFLPEVAAGDKRILLVDGSAIPGGLARIPAAGELRGNLAAGGRPEASALDERERWICEQVGPALRQRGLIFVGLDVIGGRLTEINVTSPTGLREIERFFGLRVAETFFDAIERRLG